MTDLGTPLTADKSQKDPLTSTVAHQGIRKIGISPLTQSYIVARLNSQPNNIVDLFDLINKENYTFTNQLKIFNSVYNTKSIKDSLG